MCHDTTPTMHMLHSCAWRAGEENLRGAGGVIEETESGGRGVGVGGWVGEDNTNTEVRGHVYLPAAPAPAPTPSASSEVRSRSSCLMPVLGHHGNRMGQWCCGPE